MSLVLPSAKEKYDRREEQNFREWARRNIETATRGSTGLAGGGSIGINTRTFVLEFIIDGGGAPITAGIKGDLYINFTGVITSVTLAADQTGSMVVDIWKDTYTNFPPVVGDSITASAKPTIAAANQSKDTTLVGWDTALVADSYLRFNVDSCSLITRCTVALTVVKTKLDGEQLLAYPGIPIMMVSGTSSVWNAPTGATPTKVPFDTVVAEDSEHTFSTSSNNFTVAFSGAYRLYIHLFHNGGGAVKKVDIAVCVFKNGVEGLRNTVQRELDQVWNTECTFLSGLAASDVVDIRVQHTETVAVSFDLTYSRMMLEQLTATPL